MIKKVIPFKILFVLKVFNTAILKIFWGYEYTIYLLFKTSITSSISYLILLKLKNMIFNIIFSFFSGKLLRR